ncbi:MAG: DUF6320 domain-containing protein [Eubacteriales bacterium]|nr:DUF6320 domain-containing protein [Eubacteriales bacterium]MDD3197912.1 DUF6320 domain-containing protein [Eubacteriales bacterium]MDD3503108.1 DUF6320 domain-containing protein [Eubacteriales bacterium]MDD4683430.1 DUF6320 domain-containing protein [Eubacteriales bacterium]
MSYCVNCGVELEESEKNCPLCGVEVINPRMPYVEGAPRPYPARLDPINARMNRRFIAVILSIIIAFPAVLTLSINYIYSGEAGWSAYVASSMVLLWFFIVPLFLWQRLSFLRVVIPAVIALAGFLRFMEYLNPGSGWYLKLALPVLCLVAVPFAIIGWLIEKNKLRSYYAASVIMFVMAMITFAVEFLTESYAYGSVKMDWSFYAAIPLGAIAAALLAIARRRSWRDRINRRIHI